MATALQFKDIPGFAEAWAAAEDETSLWHAAAWCEQPLEEIAGLPVRDLSIREYRRLWLAGNAWAAGGVPSATDAIDLLWQQSPEFVSGRAGRRGRKRVVRAVRKSIKLHPAAGLTRIFGQIDSYIERQFMHAARGVAGVERSAMEAALIVRARALLGLAIDEVLDMPLPRLLQLLTEATDTDGRGYIPLLTGKCKAAFMPIVNQHNKQPFTDANLELAGHAARDAFLAHLNRCH